MMKYSILIYHSTKKDNYYDYSIKCMVSIQEIIV